MQRDERRCLPAPDRALPRLLRRQPAIEHWGEQFALHPDNSLKLSIVCQGLSREAARAAWQPFLEWVKTSPDFTVTDELGAGAKPARSWWEVEGNRNMVRDQRAGASPGHGWWEGDQDQVGELSARL